MKIKIEAYIDDSAEEYLMNLVAQEYYSEAWEFITRLTDAFNKGLYIIAGRTLNLTMKRRKNNGRTNIK